MTCHRTCRYNRSGDCRNSEYPKDCFLLQKPAREYNVKDFKAKPRSDHNVADFDPFCEHDVTQGILSDAIWNHKVILEEEG